MQFLKSSSHEYRIWLKVHSTLLSDVQDLYHLDFFFESFSKWSLFLRSLSNQELIKVDKECNQACHLSSLIHKFLPTRLKLHLLLFKVRHLTRASQQGVLCSWHIQLQHRICLQVLLWLAKLSWFCSIWLAFYQSLIQQV